MAPTTSPLLRLPQELRLEIWELLLSPASRQSSGHAITTITRKCVCSTGPACTHGCDEIDGACSAQSFHMLNSREHLAPQLLRVSRQVRDEALPSLYGRRMFEAKGSRARSSSAEGEELTEGVVDAHDEHRLSMQHSWFLLDRWLERLSERARRCVRAIALPMFLSCREVCGARAAFYSISSRLACLHRVNLQLCPSRLPWSWFRRDRVLDRSDGASDWSDGEFWLGPIMAFAHASIDISAVDLLGLGDDEFGKIKTVLEIDAWRQLLPLRTTRDSRRIRRIQRALEVLEYSDVEGLREDYLTDMLSIDDNIN